LENQVVVHGSRVTVSHKIFPTQMTERQLKTVNDRMLEEIKLYAPEAELEFVRFPIIQRKERGRNSDADTTLVI
jgi:hypothetical protein